MVVVALKTWGHQLGMANLIVYCDNESTILVINSGKSSDNFMQQCLRELCYVTAKAQCVFRGVHLPGSRIGCQNCCLDGRSVSRPGSSSVSSPQGETWLRCKRRNVSPDFPMIGRPWCEWLRSASVRRGSAHLLGIQIQCVLHKQASPGPPSLRWRLATLRA